MRARTIIVTVLLLAAVACTGRRMPPRREAGPADPVRSRTSSSSGPRTERDRRFRRPGRCCPPVGAQLAAPDGSRLYATVAERRIDDPRSAGLLHRRRPLLARRSEADSTFGPHR